MTLLAIVSFLAPVFSLAAKGGMAHQAVKNYRRKSVEGVSIPFFIIGIFSYASLALLGVLIHSLPVVIAQLPGVIITVVVSVQAFRYRKTCLPEPDQVDCGYAKSASRR